MIGRRTAVLFLAALLVAATPAIARVAEFDTSATSLPGISEGYSVEGSQISSIVGGPKEEVCAFCLKVTDQLAAVLADPDTAAETVAIMQGAVCPQLPEALQQQCLDAVEEYVPQIFLAIQGLLSIDTVCVDSNICPANIRSSGSIALALAPLQTPQTCQLCLAIANRALKLLQDGKTEEQILDALHAACLKLKSPDVSEKCAVAVDAYVPQAIDLLRTVSPKEVCALTKSCPLSPLDLLRQWAVGAKDILMSPRTVSAKLALAERYVEGSLQTPQECTLCRFLVSQAAKKLKDPANQVKLTLLLSEACDRVPDFSEQCKAAVLQYLPKFFNNIDTMADPLKFCTQAKLCALPAFDAVAQLIALPTARG